MKHIRILTLLIAALAAGGCLNPLSPRESQELRRAEAKWESKNIHDYTFEMRTSCFCGSEVHEWAIVEVRDDQIVSARSLDGDPLTGFALSSRKTVDQLFDAAKADRFDWVADIDFTFDSELGYPLEINFESKPNIADAGLTYQARNLQPL